LAPQTGQVISRGGLDHGKYMWLGYSLNRSVDKNAHYTSNRWETELPVVKVRLSGFLPTALSPALSTDLLRNTL